jgi:hypothetical protein
MNQLTSNDIVCINSLHCSVLKLNIMLNIPIFFLFSFETFLFFTMRYRLLFGAFSSSLSVALAADCSQPIPSGGPDSQTLSNFISPTIPNICGSTQTGGQTTTSQEGYSFTISLQGTDQLDSQTCQDGFNNIVSMYCSR